jgi:citrate lyase subunit beta/citryl-CoA lyase
MSTATRLATNAAPHRSYLFVPGNRADRFDKALASGADTVILDLEDAVPPDAKDAARVAVAAWLAAGHPVVLRINPADTPWFRDDLALCTHPGVAAVMLPKAEQGDDVAALAGAAAVIPLVETARGLANVRAIAAARNVQRLAFGAIDFQLDLAMRATFDDLLPFRAEIVLASRLAGIGTPIDSPTVAFDDAPEVERDAAAARRLGFGAKLCIHPKQVEAVNRAFSPSATDIAWARRVIEIADASAGAAVALDGKMIDKPVILRARAILRELR